MLQDDRTQGYTLARHIYTDLGLKRVALLRVNDRYGRFGVGKFRDASRRLGHPVVIEQKFFPYDTDFSRQLKVISESRVDAIVLWTDEPKAAMILKQMREHGMKQRVFGSHRTLGDQLVALAGPAAEGYQAVYPYDPNMPDPAWLAFKTRYEAKYHEKPDHFSALAYDQMQILLQVHLRGGPEPRHDPRCAVWHGELLRASPARCSSIPTTSRYATCIWARCTTATSSIARSRCRRNMRALAKTACNTLDLRALMPPKGPRTVAVFGPGADNTSERHCPPYESPLGS